MGAGSKSQTAPDLPLQNTQKGLICAGSAVAFEDRAVLFVGASGTGKSSLCLSLLAIGATLVGDDRVVVTCKNDQVTLAPPEMIGGLIEARGVGLLPCLAKPANLAVVVSLDHVETHRLPEQKSILVEGISIPLLHKVESPYFPFAIRQYVLSGTRL